MQQNNLTVNVFFSNNEMELLSKYKDESGMSFKAILKKALDYYFKNDIPYIKSQYIFYSTIGLERKKRKTIRLDEVTSKKLYDFCEKNNYSFSSVSAQAILAYVKNHNEK